MGFLGTHFSAVFVRNGSGTAQKRPRMPKRHKMGSKLHVGNNTFNFHASHANIWPRCWGRKLWGYLCRFCMGDLIPRPQNSPQFDIKVWIFWFAAPYLFTSCHDQQNGKWYQFALVFLFLTDPKYQYDVTMANEHAGVLKTGRRQIHHCFFLISRGPKVP